MKKKYKWRRWSTLTFKQTTSAPWTAQGYSIGSIDVFQAPSVFIRKLNEKQKTSLHRSTFTSVLIPVKASVYHQTKIILQ